MYHAEKGNILAPEHYDSRKCMAAIACALKKLVFDILGQTKRPAGICSCGLKSCYDQIVHLFASVAIQRAGASTTAIESMFGTMQKLKHTIRTCHGDSESIFCGEGWRDLDPLHEIGQRNGAESAIRELISTIVFKFITQKIKENRYLISYL